MRREAGGGADVGGERGLAVGVGHDCGRIE